MNRFSTAFVISVLLHVGLFLLVFISWTTAPKRTEVSSVPVELVSQVPAHEQTETEVDKLAVKTPVPESAPEEVVKPERTPEPAPKAPVPAPQKAAAKPEKTPEPKPATKIPPDKNGAKKPEPPKKPAKDFLGDLTQPQAKPTTVRERAQANANTRRTDGPSNRGTSPSEAGLQSDLAVLTRRLQPLWNPNCDVPGGNRVDLWIAFRISSAGRIVKGPTWVESREDAVWKAAASRAISAVKQGELYDDLPASLYNRDLEIEFDARKACAG